VSHAFGGATPGRVGAAGCLLLFDVIRRRRRRPWGAGLRSWGGGDGTGTSLDGRSSEDSTQVLVWLATPPYACTPVVSRPRLHRLGEGVGVRKGWWTATTFPPSWRPVGVSRHRNNPYAVVADDVGLGVAAPG